MLKRFLPKEKHILHITQKFSHFLISMLLKTFFTCKVNSLDNYKRKSYDRPLVVVANHVSLFDSFILVSSLSVFFFFRVGLWKAPAYHTFFKSFLFKIFLLGLGAFPIKREEKLEKSLQGTLDALDKGYNLIFFPEGKRVIHGEKAKPGRGIGYLLKEKKVYVLPVHIRYSVRGKNGFGARPGRVWVNVGKVMKSEYFVENFSDENRHEEVFRQIHSLSDLKPERKSWNYRVEELRDWINKFLFSKKEIIKK